MKFSNKSPIHRLVLGGLSTAVILILTLIAFPVPHAAGAYVHLGDAGVYVAAYILGGPWGALCAAAGSALADLMLGSAIYAIPTLIIKGAMAFLAGVMIKRAPTRRFLTLALSGIIMPIGYFLFEAALLGAATALIGVPANLLQYAAGVALGVPAIRLCEKFFKE
ncbi:ECF transporter S component [Eubacteriales bacterium OttesenSCG-928-K08]|nr:ECF transporter S component [Eubacteriales bacterium OttesenSCG-928-K08]